MVVQIGDVVAEIRHRHLVSGRRKLKTVSDMMIDMVQHRRIACGRASARNCIALTKHEIFRGGWRGRGQGCTGRNAYGAIAVEILVEAGLKLLQRGARCCIDGKGLKVAVAVGIPDRELPAAGILQRDLIAA